MLKENLLSVKEHIDQACRRSGRSPEDVLLLAVSKKKPESDIIALYEAGHRDFGENYVQELREKAEHLPKDIRWHMIGHLQKNKVKYIAPYISMIHSVDSAELADVIEKEAAKAGRVIPVLIEVNVGEEESKFGVSCEDAAALAEHILSLPHVLLRGFMTSAPYVLDPEEDRPVFRKLKQLAVDMNLENADNEKVDFLSMGMSNDYEIAIEEGSSCIRVGTSIFGERN
ncbi:MAG: YggS family pyridoxal phosphate-dependent enzyme [Lachnospiraceae bacterium]|nr:YggS family pyridoxal phosphate-dependent enzyme [Lachnospiraceae bacterium]